MNRGDLMQSSQRKDQKAEFERAWDKKKIKLLFFFIFSQNVDNR